MSKEDAAASALAGLKETEKQESVLDVEGKTPGKTGETAALQAAAPTGTTHGAGDAADTASGRSRDETEAEPPRVKRKYKKREKEPVHRYPVPPKVVTVVQKSKAFVNHSYNDFSCVPPEAGYQPKSDIEKMTFAQKVHQMVSDESNGYAISWLPHGRAFKILVPKFLETTVLPRYFDHSRYSRFLTQLRTHGFKTLTTGIDQGSYYHECFLRGRPHLCKYMPIHELDPRRKTPDPENEPNFYEISRRYPLEQQVPHYQQQRAASAPPGMNLHLSTGFHEQHVGEQGPERNFLPQQQAAIGAGTHPETMTQTNVPYAPQTRNLHASASLFPAESRMMSSRHQVAQGEKRPNEMNVYSVPPHHQYTEPQWEGGQYEANRYNVPPRQWGQEEGEGSKIQDFQRFKRMDTALAQTWYPGSHAAGMPNPSDDSHHHKTSVDPAFASMTSYPPFAPKEYPDSTRIDPPFVAQKYPGATRFDSTSQPYYPQIGMQSQQESHQMHSQQLYPRSQEQNIRAQHQQSLQYDPHFQHEYSHQLPPEAPGQGTHFVARRLLYRSLSDPLSPGHGETNDSMGHEEIGYFSPSNIQQPPANTPRRPPP